MTDGAGAVIEGDVAVIIGDEAVMLGDVDVIMGLLGVLAVVDAAATGSLPVDDPERKFITDSGKRELSS